MSHELLGPDVGGEDRLLVVPATLAKGLEYDHVIVLEPAGIARTGAHGLALLYVVLTLVGGTAACLGGIAIAARADRRREQRSRR